MKISVWKHSVGAAAIVVAVFLSGVAARPQQSRAGASVPYSGPELLGILAAESTAAPTTDPSNVVHAGQLALMGDSRRSDVEWNEFFHSRTDPFQPMHAYRIRFDYRVLARDGNAEFYTLLRRRSSQSGDIGPEAWQGAPGDTGHIVLPVVVRHADDYYLIIGIHYKGALAIDDLTIAPEPANAPIDVLAPSPARTWKSPGGTTYYVDSLHGRDSANGRTPAQAWCSLSRVNSGTFGPGDNVLLRAGSSWRGFLSPGGSGSRSRPITVATYGSSSRPKIDAQGKWLDTVLLSNQEYVTVRGLEVANHGEAAQPHLAGVAVRLDNFGTAHDIVLDDLFVHDVTGSDVKSQGGGSGIDCTADGAAPPSRFDGLLIENCHLVHTDRNGITTGGNASRSDWYPSLHVVIRNNRLDDIGGDGIVPIACDGALVEHNVLHGGQMRADDYAAGIWPWSCDNTVIQYNEVSGMRGTKDGEGFDSDWNCRNSLFQYNYSHDNEGGFMLICDDGTQTSSYSAGNVGTVIRYNISIDDGSLRTFNITGPCRNTSIYNNTIYVPKGRTVRIVTAGNWGGSYAADTRFDNNIFYVAGSASFDLGGMTGVAFDNNAFWDGVTPPGGAVGSVVADPRLAAPGSLVPTAYVPQSGSPCIGAGAIIPNNGGRDFASHIVPVDSNPMIGALQAP